jgi:large subunit ribosomal protein L53
VRSQRCHCGIWNTRANIIVEDGKEMNLELDKMRITEIMEQVDRHSRTLARKEELTGN